LLYAGEIEVGLGGAIIRWSNMSGKKRYRYVYYFSTTTAAAHSTKQYSSTLPTKPYSSTPVKSRLGWGEQSYAGVK